MKKDTSGGLKLNPEQLAVAVQCAQIDRYARKRMVFLRSILGSLLNGTLLKTCHSLLIMLRQDPSERCGGFVNGGTNGKLV